MQAAWWGAQDCCPLVGEEQRCEGCHNTGDIVTPWILTAKLFFRALFIRARLLLASYVNPV